jgi:hypothetical protein
MVLDDGASPPVTSTFPEDSSAAAWKNRAAWRLPVGVHVPVAGS